MFNIILRDIKELILDKKIWIGMLTVLIIFIIGTSYNTEKEQEDTQKRLQLGIVNLDTSAYSKLLLNYIESNRTISTFLEARLGEQDELTKEFHEGNLDIYVEIPRDFAKNMIRIEHIPIRVLLNIEDTTKAIIFQNALKSYEKYITSVEVNAVGLYDIMEQHGMDQKLIDDTNTIISMNLIFTALGKDTLFKWKEVSTITATNLVQYYLLSLFSMVLLYGGLYGGFKLLKEMTMGTFERLKTTKTNTTKALVGNISLIWFLLFFISIFGMKILLGMKVSLPMVLLSLGISAFVTIFPAFFTVFFKTSQQYLLFVNLLMFYFILVGGGMVPLMYLPKGLLQMARVTPFYYMMKGMIELGYDVRSNSLLYGGVFLGISVLLFVIMIGCFNRRSTYEKE